MQVSCHTKKQISYLKNQAIYMTLKNILPFSEKFVHLPKSPFTYCYYSNYLCLTNHFAVNRRKHYMAYSPYRKTTNINVTYYVI